LPFVQGKSDIIVVQLRVKHNVSHAILNCFTKVLQHAFEEAEQKSMVELSFLINLIHKTSETNL
jgi:hypothetical protein